MGHGGLPGLAPPGRPDDRRRPGEPEDGPGRAADLRPDARAALGHLDGRLRVVRRHVQQLRDRAGRGPHRAGRHLPARLPAAAGDADRRHPQDAREGHGPAARPERPQDARGAQGRGQATGGGAGRDAVVVPGGQGAPGGVDPGGQGRPRGAAAHRELDEAAAAPAGGGQVTTNPPSDGGVPATQPVGADFDAPAQIPPSPYKGMFGVKGTGDVSGFGGLARRTPAEAETPRPFGGYFDEVYDALEEAYAGFSDAIERVVVDRGELTLHVKPERIAEVCQTMRDDESLRFELCSSVDGVDYLGSDPRRFHISY